MVEESVQAYQSTPLPAIDDLFDYHYANIPAQLEAQKQEALAREESRQQIKRRQLTDRHQKLSGGHAHG
ncbi:MAG: hypothetical protein ACPG5T_02855 [Endozoicomonas sp.]